MKSNFNCTSTRGYLSNKDMDAISNFTSIIESKLSGTNERAPTYKVYSKGDLVLIAIKNIF